MSTSPSFKIYDAHGKYQASVHEIEAAAVLVTFYDTGSQIRHGHSFVVWREGYEDCPAEESHDVVALTVGMRLDERLQRIRTMCAARED